MKIRAFNIQYDTPNQNDLPAELFFDVDNDTDIDDELADMISDETGWCVISAEYEVI